MKRRMPHALCVLVLSLPFMAGAQTLEELGALDPEERRAFWQGLSEEEREAKVAEWRAKLDSMSPEQKDAMREMLAARREELRARWDEMSPEEREALRARMRERAEKMSPEEREAMRDLMREHREALTPEERKALREKRRQRAPEPPATTD
jgi:Spy/CpxP family protein refolding chaperone